MAAGILGGFKERNKDIQQGMIFAVKCGRGKKSPVCKIVVMAE